MAMQGAMAQVDGVTGASVQTTNALLQRVKAMLQYSGRATKVRLQKLLNKGIMPGHQDDPGVWYYLEMG